MGDVIVCTSGEFKPGDPAPDGYLDRQEWHRVQVKAGYRQGYCKGCECWLYPFEECEHTEEEARRAE